MIGPRDQRHYQQISDYQQILLHVPGGHQAWLLPRFELVTEAAGYVKAPPDMVIQNGSQVDNPQFEPHPGSINVTYNCMMI